jgi:hypothetical protein
MKRKAILSTIVIAAMLLSAGGTVFASEKSMSKYYFLDKVNLGIQGEGNVKIGLSIFEDYIIPTFNLKLIKEFNKGKIIGCLKSETGNEIDKNGLNIDIHFPISILINIKVTELFYEYPFSVLDRKFTLDLGKLSLFETFASNKYTSDFITKSFSNDKLISGTPDTNPGIKLNLALTDEIDIDCACFTASNESALFSIFQITYKPSSYDLLKNGNYRAYIWRDSKPCYCSRHCRRGRHCISTWNYPKIYGGGISLDKKINEYFGLFGKFAYKNSNSNALKGKFLSWNTGLQATLPPNLGSIIGLAAGQIYERNCSPETQLELYYKFTLNNNITVSPSVQYFISPSNENRKHEINCGIKVNVKF